MNNNFYGLHMFNSSNNTITNNIIYFNLGRGIKMEYSSYNSFIGNNVLHDGGLSSYYSYHTLIKNNDFRYAFGGVFFKDSSDIILEKNFITGIAWSAIDLIRSPRAEISNNEIINNGDYGVFLQSSPYITITDNIIRNNERDGIVLRGQGNIVTGNIIENNGDGYYDGGITIEDCKDSVITDNLILNNSNGIRITTRTSNNTVTRNIISYSDIAGIDTYASGNNIVYLNNFIGNNVTTDCYNSTNKYDNGVFGNYWSDYDGRDKDGDGIGDTPKYIEENSFNDSYPLMVPYGPNTSIRITTPREGYIYFRNIRLKPISSNIVFGNIKIKASAANYMNNTVKVEKVEFYVDGRLRWVDRTVPFSWRWRLSSPLKHNHTISVIVYDSSGETAVDEMQTWRFL